MKIIFFGTGDFGLSTLKRLIKSGHDIAAVVTQPDKKKGRGMGVHPTPVKALIEDTMPGTDVLQPGKLTGEFIEDIKRPEADVFVVVDYGKILPVSVLELPKRYCINLHPSLLPKYRGSSPVNQAILNGDAVTGNTVIKINERMDAGEILLQEEFIIGKDEDALSLSERLSAHGAELIIKTLDMIAAGKETLTAQDESEATYAAKLKKEDGEIDWTRTAEEIDRKIRGLKPWPGAFTYINGKMLKILEAEIAPAQKDIMLAGTVFLDKERLLVSAS
ncbi:MAG: methionyl-tRNA formyltransferase, partial [Candidatus Omnitrophica bacterium]|nr:methionyl-tRNA formyltransferase [Candidatus Omnitrophota bacterium]